MTITKIKLDKRAQRRIEFIANGDNKRKGKIANIILLRHKGKKISEIVTETGMSKGTVIKYLKNYQDDANKTIHRLPAYKISILDDIKEPLINEFKKNPFSTYKEATQRINIIYNINLSESAVRRYLNKYNIYSSNSRLQKSKIKR